MQKETKILMRIETIETLIRLKIINSRRIVIIILVSIIIMITMMLENNNHHGANIMNINLLKRI